MKYICNPLNIGYKYQFNKTFEGKICVSREAADPSMILFQGRYFLFPSMSCGFWHSLDLVEWVFQPLSKIPVYDYAPDVRAVGEYLYFCASNHEQGVFFRTKNPFSGEFEKIEGDFPFWDPDLFVDDDGRFYFYWGSSTTEPIYGIELDSRTMKPLGKRIELFWPSPDRMGFERSGENHVPERTPEEKQAILDQIQHQPLTPEMRQTITSYVMGLPYIEGAWMTKHEGRYYLQYGTPGSGANIYADGVYVSEFPLGPFRAAENNPYSYMPGGFSSGAGHGSTMEDRYGNWWHVSTSRICQNHNFERRIGLWPAGWDRDGGLFCNQRFGDWPRPVRQGKMDPWKDPEWMLISYRKNATASSFAEGRIPANVTDENIRTVWTAASNRPGEWIEVDLGHEYDIRAVQINFADDGLSLSLPEGEELHGALHQERWIDPVTQNTRWTLEASRNAREYYVIKDKSGTATDLPHDLVVLEKGLKARYLRLRVESLPYHQAACVSGLRVFGLGGGNPPDPATEVSVLRTGELDIDIRWVGKGIGYLVTWGYAPDKLYHSYEVFSTSAHLGGLVKGQTTYFRVDSFNESGITKGTVLQE